MDWLAQVWTDFWRHTGLFPLELLVVCVLVMAAQVPEFRHLALPSECEPWISYASRPRIALAIVFAFTLAGHFVVEPNYRIPSPAFHDEYSYLLAADTFASGRLTNGAHPMRFFFESFHILIEPTYMSMYPPAQGAMLAVGKVLTGEAIAGVWLSAALAAMATCWMLQGSVPRRWALFGGLLFGIRIGWFSYWANSYWGGCVPALGGALLFGGAFRLLRQVSVRHSLWTGFGALILVNSRLWEGTVLTIVVIVYVALRMPRTKLTPALVPMVVVGLLGLSLMAYYNWRITGNALRLPYLENRAKYQVFGSFLWEKPNRLRVYNHEIMRKFYFESEGYRDHVPYWQVQVEKPKRIWFFFFGPALTLPLFGLWKSWQNKRLRLAWIGLAFFALAHLVVPWNLLPHYAGPVAGVLYLLVIAGARNLQRWRFGERVFAGSGLMRAAFAACLVLAVLRAVAPAAGVSVFGEFTMPWYSYALHSNWNRQKIEESLASLPGEDLVLVQYDENHPPDFEWVYNRADIDAAPVIWARMVPDHEKLKTLLDYYSSRKIWIVYPDQDPTRVSAFREAKQ